MNWETGVLTLDSLVDGRQGFGLTGVIRHHVDVTEIVLWVP